MRILWTSQSRAVTHRWCRRCCHTRSKCRGLPAAPPRPCPPHGTDASQVVGLIIIHSLGMTIHTNTPFTIFSQKYQKDHSFYILLHDMITASLEQMRRCISLRLSHLIVVVGGEVGGVAVRGHPELGEGVDGEVHADAAGHGVEGVSYSLTLLLREGRLTCTHHTPNIGW